MLFTLKNSMPVNNHHLSLFHLLKFDQPMVTETEQNEQGVEQFYDFLKQPIASNEIACNENIRNVFEYYEINLDNLWNTKYLL